MSWIPLKDAEAIAPGESKEFTLNSSAGPVELFVVNHNGQLHAYRNQCPHTGVNLNWQPNQFMDLDNQFIQCSTHGALFRIHDGYCVRGPCAGASLAAISLKTDDGNILVNIE